MNLRWHAFYLGLIAILLFAALTTGARLQRAGMTQARAIEPEPLYQAIRQEPGRYQVLDLRAAGDFEDGHLPQTLNLEPGFVLPEAPVDRYRPTVIVTEDGDPEMFRALAEELAQPRNLEGGMLAWRMSRMPEVTGVLDTDAMGRGPVG